MVTDTELYLYVDGESHYIRNEAKLKKLFGPDVDLAKVWVPGYKLVIDPLCRFFWDEDAYGVFNIQPYRKVYFSAYSASDERTHRLNQFVRSAGFEPQLFKEDKDLLNNRKTALRDSQIIEKPKGADIMLAVRMIEDAVQGNYQRCLLFTSDADFLPVIRAVRRLGKFVTVYGFADGINPEMTYVPDKFIDLGELYSSNRSEPHYRLTETDPSE